MDNNKLFKYANLVFEYNQKKNITGFKTLEEIIEQGINDSVISFDQSQYINIDFGNKYIADIGAGAGFPSLPSLIKNNNFNLTIIEGMQSRCDFLNSVKNELSIDKLRIINSRAEKTKNLSNTFDIVCARAVSSIKNMFMLCHHLLKPGGLFYLLKGRNYQSEIEEFLNTFPDQKENIQVHEYRNVNNETSYIVLIRKNTKTPSNWPLSWKIIQNF